MDVFDLVRGWGLDERPGRPPNFTRAEIDRLFDEFEQLYDDPPMARAGTLNMGVREATRLMESEQPNLSALAVPVLLADRVWLPDPLFSSISTTAGTVWGSLPDSGSDHFGFGPAIHTPWKAASQLTTGDRKRSMREALRIGIPRLLELEPLVRTGALYIYPWERTIAGELEKLGASAGELADVEVAAEVTKRHLQQNYSCGVRTAGIGISFQSSEFPGIKCGDPAWLGDIRPILLYGLVNATMSDRLGARFDPELVGDRVVYDFVRTGGVSTRRLVPVGAPLRIPGLDSALWPDIAAIRSDAELLATMRALIAKLSEADSEQSAEMLAAELQEVARKLADDAALTKVIKAPSLELTLSVLGGAGAGTLAGSPLAGAIAGAVVGGLPKYIADLAVGAFGGRAATGRARNEVVARALRRLTSAD